MKSEVWDCIDDELQTSCQLQHDLLRMPWGEGFKQSGMLLGKVVDRVWRKGVRTVSQVTEPKGELKRRGPLHKALAFSISFVASLLGGPHICSCTAVWRFDPGWGIQSTGHAQTAKAVSF